MNSPTIPSEDLLSTASVKRSPTVPSEDPFTAPVENWPTVSSEDSSTAPVENSPTFPLEDPPTAPRTRLLFQRIILAKLFYLGIWSCDRRLQQGEEELWRQAACRLQSQLLTRLVESSISRLANGKGRVVVEVVVVTR